tara:strand:- start:11477 stop:11668 length:192 start_codon:yes stop_codon:yes gene_type:complete
MENTLFTSPAKAGTLENRRSSSMWIFLFSANTLEHEKASIQYCFSHQSSYAIQSELIQNTCEL